MEVQSIIETHHERMLKLKTMDQIISWNQYRAESKIFVRELYQLEWTQQETYLLKMQKRPIKRVSETVVEVDDRVLETLQQIDVEIETIHSKILSLSISAVEPVGEIQNEIGHDSSSPHEDESLKASTIEKENLEIELDSDSLIGVNSIEKRNMEQIYDFQEKDSEKRGNLQENSQASLIIDWLLCRKETKLCANKDSTEFKTLENISFVFSQNLSSLLTSYSQLVSKSCLQIIVRDHVDNLTKGDIRWTLDMLSACFLFENGSFVSKLNDALFWRGCQFYRSEWNQELAKTKVMTALQESCPLDVVNECELEFYDNGKLFSNAQGTFFMMRL
jgi:hypothetical protein